MSLDDQDGFGSALDLTKY